MKKITIIEHINETDLVLFGRDENGNRIKEEVRDMKPYFYVEDLEGEYTSLFGEKLKKVYTKTPREVPAEREKYDKHYEADIIYINRYLIDHVPVIEYTRLRKHYMDIELGTKGAFPSITEARCPISCVSAYDNFLDKIVTFVWREDLEEKTIKKDKSSIYYFNNEKQMLNKYFDFIRDTDPDIMTGWNIDRFDMKYLYHRCQKIGVPIYKISPMIGHTVYPGKYDDYIIVKGRIIFDLLLSYKKLHVGEMESFSLDSIANQELGESKIKVGMSFYDLWRSDIEKLVEYNQRDVILTRRIDKQKNVISFYNNLRLLAGCTMSNTLSNMAIIDSLMLRKAKEVGLVLPSREKKKREPFKGAHVFEPKPGLHENVSVFDLKSLYPSIIISFNMSPETLSKWGGMEVGNGVFFSDKKQGLVPKILDDMFKLRQQYQKKEAEAKFDSADYKTYEMMQFTTKCIINSVYGVMASPYFRLHSPDVAKSVTYVGRQAIKWTHKKISEYSNDLEVIYGDTDSVFVKSKTDNPIEFSKQIEEYLNKSYNEFASECNLKNHIFSTKFEKLYKIILFGKSKKKYAGQLTYKDGETVDSVDIVGFEIKRSDSAAITKDIQLTVLKMMLNKELKEDILDYIKKEKEKLYKGEYEVEYFALPKSIVKKDYKTNTVQSRAAKYSNTFIGTELYSGSKFKILYLRQMPIGYPSTDVIAFSDTEQLPEGIKVDWERMMPILIDNKIERIFNAVDWNYIITSTNTTSLYDFEEGQQETNESK